MHALEDAHSRARVACQGSNSRLCVSGAVLIIYNTPTRRVNYFQRSLQRSEGHEEIFTRWKMFFPAGYAARVDSMAGSFVLIRVLFPD